MSWKVPSGNVLLMVIGNMPPSSSLRAISIGFVMIDSASTRMGAPMEI